MQDKDKEAERDLHKDCHETIQRLVRANLELSCLLINTPGGPVVDVGPDFDCICSTHEKHMKQKKQE